MRLMDGGRAFGKSRNDEYSSVHFGNPFWSVHSRRWSFYEATSRRNTMPGINAARPTDQWRCSLLLNLSTISRVHSSLVVSWLSCTSTPVPYRSIRPHHPAGTPAVASLTPRPPRTAHLPRKYSDPPLRSHSTLLLNHPNQYTRSTPGSLPKVVL